MQIDYKDIVRYNDISFEEYLKLNGYSHSYLKNNINGVKKFVDITDNIRIGALVDKILTEPNAVNMSDELYPCCKAIAFKIKEFFGEHIKALKSQVSFTANACFGNFSLPTQGRLDFLLEGFATIDIKVTKSKTIDSLISFMGYENQLWHYSKMAKTPKAYLIIYSIPLKQVFVRSVNVVEELNSFWMKNIIDFGTVIKPQLI